MPAPNVIPYESYPKILKWWLSGHSTRAIQKLLAMDGVELSQHTSIWRLIQRFSSGHGNAEVAAAIAQTRHQFSESLTTMEDIESMVESGTRKDATAGWVDHVKHRLPALTALHRMHGNRLRLAGINSPTSLATYERFSAYMHSNAVDESKAMHMPWPLPVELEGMKSDAEKVLPFGAPKPLIEAESKSNTPPPSTIPETAEEVPKIMSVSKTVQMTHSEPGRNTRCRCGSGLKFKRCCAGLNNAANSSDPPKEVKPAA